MKRAILFCALLALLLAAAPTTRHVEIDGAGGTRIGGGYVTTALHVVGRRGAVRTDRHVATRHATGRTGVDDGDDWALLRCRTYDGDGWLAIAEPAVGDECWYQRGSKRRPLTVENIDEGAAGFSGTRPIPGDSGSGVYRASDGALVGHITSRLSTAPG